MTKKEKKEKYEELAQKALRECLQLEGTSQEVITTQISKLYTKYVDTVEQTNFKEYLKTICPFFYEIEKEEDIPEFLDILKEIFKKEYQKFESKRFKPTQVLAILLVLEDLWGYSKLKNDVMEKLERFSIEALLVSKLYFWNLDERYLWDFCNDLNKVF